MLAGGRVDAPPPVSMSSVAPGGVHANVRAGVGSCHPLHGLKLTLPVRATRAVCALQTVVAAVCTLWWWTLVQESPLLLLLLLGGSGVVWAAHAFCLQAKPKQGMPGVDVEAEAEAEAGRLHKKNKKKDREDELKEKRDESGGSGDKDEDMRDQQKDAEAEGREQLPLPRQQQQPQQPEQPYVLVPLLLQLALQAVSMTVACVLFTGGESKELLRAVGLPATTPSSSLVSEAGQPQPHAPGEEADASVEGGVEVAVALLLFCGMIYCICLAAHMRRKQEAHSASMVDRFLLVPHEPGATPLSGAAAASSVNWSGSLPDSASDLRWRKRGRRSGRNRGERGDGMDAGDRTGTGADATDDDEDGSDGEFAAPASSAWSTARPARSIACRLLAFSAQEGTLVGVGTVALFIGTGCQLAVPHFIGKIIDSISESKDKAQLTEYVCRLGAIFLVGSFFVFVRGTIFTLVGERIVARIRRQLYQHIISLHVGFFDKNKTGELMNRLSSDTSVLQNALATNLSMGVRSAAQALFALGMLFYTSWRLTVVMLAIVPPLAMAGTVYGKYMKRIVRAYQAELARAADCAQEALSSVRTVKSFGAEALEMRKYSDIVTESYALGRNKAYAFGIMIAGVGFLGSLAVAVVLWVGGTEVIDGSMSPGDLTSFILLTTYVGFGLSTLSNIYSQFMTAIGASVRIFDIFDTAMQVEVVGGHVPGHVGGASMAGAATECCHGRVDFQNVEFSYPTRPVPILRGFSLHISPQQTVALVGTSGSGKSTVLNLLQRFYDVAGGSILVDGVDVRALDPRWLKRNIGVVSQEPVLFSGTIRDNILYGQFADNAAANMREDEQCPGAFALPPMDLSRPTRGVHGSFFVGADRKEEDEHHEEEEKHGGNGDNDGNGGTDGPRSALASAQQAAVETAAKQANAHDFIMGFPERYDTVVGERGVRLSGGQKQRVAIARALLKDPKILLLDEATSALDAESEHVVQEAIDRLMQNRSVIVIAHRLSTVRDAHMICVMHQGAIQGQGTHEELLETCPLYKQLVSRQLSNNPAAPASSGTDLDLLP